MDNVLSKEETDALLKGIDDGSVPTETGTGCEGDLRAFEIAEHNQIVRGRMPVLERINERFARVVRDTLAELLKHEIGVTAGGLRIATHGEYTKTLQAPSSLNLIKVSPLPGNVLVAFDPALVYLAVDSYFGGPGRAPANLEDRQFTRGELRVIALLRDAVLARLAESWEPVRTLGFEHDCMEANPRFLDFAPDGQPVVISDFEIAFEGGKGALHVTFPQATLEPVRALLDGGAKAADDARNANWSSAVRQRLDDADLEIGAALASLPLNLGDVLRLRPGDVIPLELEETITVVSGDTPLFHARFGGSRGRNAVMLTQHLNTPGRERNANE